MTLKLGKLTILPESGRVLKLEPVSGLNVLWSNPHQGPDARGWINPGGDRTWLSPERDLFLPEGVWTSYKVPASIDPGRHEIMEYSSKRILLKNRIEALFFRQKASVGLTLTKCITETSPEIPEVEASAGYNIETRLRVEGTLPPDVFPAIWNIIQLPQGGKIFFKGKSPVSYFGLPNWKREANGLCSVEIPAEKESYKTGIAAVESQGVMAYLNATAEKPFLVVRKFEVHSKGLYFDAPADKPGSPCVQQIFSDNGAEGGFGEMEYHSDALTPEKTEIVDRCSTMAFVAEKKILEKMLEQLFS